MRLYRRSQDDKGWSISRCHFDAEHSRVDLALARLKDLLDEFPNDAKIVYAEGVIRRDFLGQGLAARELFEKAYHLDNEHWFAAENVIFLSRSEEEFRRWVEIFQKLAPPDEPGRKVMASVIKDLDNGMRYWEALTYASQAGFEAGRFGPSAAIMELVLFTGERSLADEVRARHNRAQCLRALDKEAHRYREAIREAFNPEERLALHEAMIELDKAIEIDEYDAELWNFKSAWCFFLERHEDAIRCADRAIKLRPFGYPKPYINKAAALESLGKNSEALTCARMALEQAEKSESAADIIQARRNIEDFSTSIREASLQDLEEPIISHIINAVSITSDLEVGLLPSRSIEILIKGFAGKALKIGSERSIDYVPLVAELLSDFTPETAVLIVLKSFDYSQSVHEHCMNASLYVAAHSEDVQQRDAARFIALNILQAGKSDDIRHLYRKAILETSAAATDEMSRLDEIMREELNRMNRLFPRLVADQEPVDEEGRARAIRYTISMLAGKPSRSARPVRQNYKGNAPPLALPAIPTPTRGGVIFNLIMQAAPFIGLGVGWLVGRGIGSAVGFFAGMVVACIGWGWFFFIKTHAGTTCEVCGRPFTKGPAPPPWSENAGVMFSTAGMQSGSEGPGDECANCGRIFCTACAQFRAGCKCGATRFRTVRLIYR